MIVADTGAVVALIDADDRHHEVLRALFEADPQQWVLPWAVLPEVDDLVQTHVGAEAQETFLAGLDAGVFSVEWGQETDLSRARALCARYRALKLGLVDAAVMAIAERLQARAVATLDVRDFGAVALQGKPLLFPRDL